ncbi:MAG: anaerobic sulfatase maturase [Ruminococcaceae bacterium]|nr:anaerobic sulfatase maturase [Oscillospiraceae bacterium]
MRSVNLLIKPASSLCNMRCKYCFYHDVAENREIESYGLMSEETAKNLIDRAFEYADSIVFAFQGGEPTLCGHEFFEKFTDYVKAKQKENKAAVRYVLQTNGLLIDEHFADIFRKNDFLVGLSLDGTKDCHDINRVDAKRNGTFSRVKKAAELLTKKGVEFNILSVITETNAKRAEANYNFYKKNGLNFIQYIPQIAPFDEQPEYASLSAESYGKFLCTTFDLWYRDFAAGEYISIRDIDNYCGILMGRRPEICTLQGRCSCNFTVEANGNVYPCDFYVLDEYLLGNLKDRTLEEMINCDTAKRFIKESFVEQEECKDCKWRTLCRTGCRRNKEPLKETGGRQFFCESYKAFFEHCYDRMTTVPKILETKYRNFRG